jgi:PAS domain S-box-containing protein
MSSAALQRRRPFHPVHAEAADTRLLASSAPPSPGMPLPASAPVAGRYRFDAAGEAWWWSPEMFTLHGLEPGAVQPCTQALLDAQHPSDRGRILLALTGARGGRPFSLETRVLRPDGNLRTVVIVGEPQQDGEGGITGVDGICIDLTDGRRAEDADRIHALETEVGQLRTAMASRAAIEQAKGILMLLTSCGDQVAFDLLAHISSHTHRKVREVAVAITESAAGHGGLPADIRAILQDACPPATGR